MKVFIFSWTENFDGSIGRSHVVVLAENVESARAHLLKRYLKKFRSEWRRAKNEDMAKFAEVQERELKQGVLWYDEIFI